MNTKTTLKAVLGTVAGLSLAMAAVAYAQNDHMNTNGQSGGMMGQTTQQTTTEHGNMNSTRTHQDTNGNMHDKDSTHQQSTSDHHNPAATEHHTKGSQKTYN